ncbi:hypothetical protein H072_8298 [Dactylellina haptotyla CBS 200.50]|uniref:DDHD domain-containing protein n=1 Tax=Dactylellina haptotyla (strain CBS 200.50) TaxID=1284197 RepID=S8AA57_DACHA|nr:hypothetical protein H072_8298 [Dactylellina haptotyla CBS 200.50]
MAPPRRRRASPPPPTNTPSHNHIPAPPPALLPWYFYLAPHPLDDPLAPLPLPTAGAATVRYPPRPFSATDSHALESSYQNVLAEREAKKPQTPTGVKSTSTSIPTDARPGRRRKSDPRRSTEYTSSPLRTSDVPPEMSESGTTPPPVIIPTRDGQMKPLDDIIASAADRKETRKQNRNSISSVNSLAGASTPNASPYGSYSNTAGTTSNPFIRAKSHRDIPHLRKRSKPRSSESRHASKDRKSGKSQTTAASNEEKDEKVVAVGFQRLHQVRIPSLNMEPIYWSPLHGLDNAKVIRGTWFYRDTMFPVETEKANALEKGWREVMAWTQEWAWELESAVKVGEEAEAKIRWMMPIVKTVSRPPTATLVDTTGASEDEPGEMMESGGSALNADLVRDGDIEAVDKTDASSADWVIFADTKSAYIMRDSLLAGFAGRNRRPLAAIKRGLTVGTPVIRGFDVEAWRKIHGDKYGLCENMGVKGKDGDNATRTQEKQKITDLVLVVHGIGQKLSERVESFHFTHAINGFRRLINLELRDPAVKPHLRKEGVGIMVLPVNWRSTVKFDSDFAAADEDEDAELDFSLEDITPPTIPAVRNLMGDVVMDIPYYLSHHKNKMVNAVIKEANRIYKLWCQNNPNFGTELGGGRVHLMAHSLGSAIALDILSGQPTNVFHTNSQIPSPLPLQPEKDRDDDDASYMSSTPTAPGTFDFNTTNLFCCGSPAGLFLLINRRGLIPRYKLKMENPDSSDPSVCGMQGHYGCLAIENVYNVLHYSDPIAYQLNATVDPTYAASLKRAMVPSTATGFLSYLPRYGSSTTPAKPVLPALPLRLPSSMELEVHDFSREELAERRMYLLNDCGQIDFYLRTGAGVLDSEYLNMLGAHSCYWESRDFVRLIVVEAGRERGKEGVIAGMGIEKKRELGGLLSRAGK